MDDYDIPFDDMSEEEFLYRAMDPEDPMYMGDDIDEGYDYQVDDGCSQRLEEWYEAQFDKIIDAMNSYIADPADDPRHYFDDIEYDPLPED